MDTHSGGMISQNFQLKTTFKFANTKRIEKMITPFEIELTISADIEVKTPRGILIGTLPNLVVF